VDSFVFLRLCGIKGFMRKFDVKKIADALREMAVDVNRHLSEGHIDALKQALARETSPLGKQILRRIIDNAAAARDLKLPVCQDTGTAVVFIDIGQEVQLVGGSLRDTVNDATAAACKDGLLRMSIVNDPLERKNTGTNAPAVLHTRVVPGDRVTVSFMAGERCRFRR
jgi:fumarate hydratase subunit alpha